MSEDRYTHWLDDYVDGALSDSDKSLLELHLTTCETCRTMVEDLSRIKKAAGALPRREPPKDVWRRIEASLRTQRVTSTFTRSWIFSSHLALAATVLILIGMVGLLMWWSPFSRTPENEDAGQLANYVVSELELAERHYINAIAGLEQIIEKEKEGQTLDPKLMAVLNDNLELIEQAIGESRAAAQDDPESILARESLLDALRNKLALLQNTITLINEVRKGRGESALDVLNDMREGRGTSNPI